MRVKKRLDQLLLERFPYFSRGQVQSFIMQGLVTVNDTIITKAGHQVSIDDLILFTPPPISYVSRAGIKLAHALDTFNIDVTGLVALDAGISTGGFTDCLLQRGVARVYGIDVGYGQLHYKIRSDPRVILHEKTNLRTMDPALIGEKIDLITLDLSFISLLKVLPVVKELLKPTGILIALIKPQFEAERGQVGSGGIIRDDSLREEVVQKVLAGFTAAGFAKQGICESPITGTDGNREFLAWFKQTC